MSSGIDRKLVKIIKEHPYYIAKDELWKMTADDRETPMQSAYTHDGYYIGSVKDAEYLCETRGIRPTISQFGNNVCSIGFCEKEQKWYGWSHRAIYGFGIGDEVETGSVCADSEPDEDYVLKEDEQVREARKIHSVALPVGFKAHTLDDAKRMAIAFAAGVS